MRELVRFYQRSGLQSLARASGLLKLLGIAELDALSPRIDSDFSFADLGRVYPAEGERRGPRGLAHRLHRQRGVRGTESRHHSRSHQEWHRSSHSPRARAVAELCTCMPGIWSSRAPGAPQYRRHAEPEFDAIVTNAAGCGSTMKEYADAAGARS